MDPVKKIAKNTVVLLASQIVNYVLAFFYMIYIARYLGTDGFGILSFALAFTGIFSIFADLGLNTLTVREIARDKSLTTKYFSNILLMKIILSIFTFLLVVVVINLLNYSQETINVVYLVALSVILTAISGIFNSIFQAHEKMEYQSLGQILQSLLMVIGVFIVIDYEFGILGFAFVYFISSLVSLVYIFIIYIWKFSPKIKIRWDFWKPTLKEALPFGLTSIFATIYVWIDSVMLSLMQGNEAVGIYNAAYRLILVLLFIPTVSNMAIFPVMSKFYISSLNSLKKLVEKYSKLMILIAVPLGVAITLLADKIILFVFGIQYSQSIISLKILIWATVFIFISTAFVQLLLSSDKELILTKITSICVIVNIILNLFLIKSFSFIGASITTVITEFLVLILVFITINKMGYGISKKQVKDIIKIIFASIVMGIMIFYLKDLNLLILVPLSIVIYSGIIFLIKGIDNEDLNLLKTIIQKEN